MEEGGGRRKEEGRANPDDETVEGRNACLYLPFLAAKGKGEQDWNDRKQEQDGAGKVHLCRIETGLFLDYLDSPFSALEKFHSSLPLSPLSTL